MADDPMADDEVMERINRADEAISVAQAYTNSAQWSDDGKMQAILNALITVHDEVTAVAHQAAELRDVLRIVLRHAQTASNLTAKELAIVRDFAKHEAEND